MRKIHTIITLVTVGTSSAQLTDPGFEQYGVNWDHWCTWEFVNDVPPGGGNVSLRLPLVTGISPDCFVEEGLQPLAYQATPSVQSGDQVTIDLWVKATPDDPNDAPWMNMVLFFGWLTSPTTFDHDPVVPTWYPATGEWTLATITQPVGDVPVGSTPVLFIGGHGFNQSPGFIQFDDVTLEVSTRIEEQPASPRSGIDAVTGNWWLETTEPLRSLSVLDALGRNVPISWQRSGPTRVDVHLNTRTGGAFTVLVSSASGLRTFRFVDVR